MKFISYAQNYEDVILWRVLEDIGTKGFYIDVGACFPDECSVTKAFYDAGWNGINIEPNPEVYNQLCVSRPRDININVAIGDKEGFIDFFEFEDELGSSTICSEIADEHRVNKRPVKVKKVKITKLNKIYKEYAKKKEVSFLKIDVEGSERSVIKSMDWKKYRPWVVVVEAMKPWLQQPTHGDWEDILLESNYTFVYADGLNRFYIAEEHAELAPAFKYPPNIFDNFLLSSQFQSDELAKQAETRTKQAETRTKQAETRTKQAETRAEQAETKVGQFQIELHSLYTSRSWRITAPLRWFTHQVRLLRQHSLFSRIKALLKKITYPFFLRGIAFVNSRPSLRLKSAALVRKLGLYEPLRAIYLRISRRLHPISAISTQKVDATPSTVDHLTPHARRIFRELKASIEERQKEDG